MDLEKSRNIIIVLAVILLIVEFVNMDYDHVFHWRTLINPLPMILIIIAMKSQSRVVGNN